MNNKRFWSKHRGYVWSNPDASDAIHIRAALLRPRFDTLLQIALEFGLDRLCAEWQVLCDDPRTETARAQPIVERCLRNIREGAALAAR